MGFVHMETITMKRLYLQSHFDSTYLVIVVGPTTRGRTSGAGLSRRLRAATLLEVDTIFGGSVNQQSRKVSRPFLLLLHM